MFALSQVKHVNNVVVHKPRLLWRQSCVYRLLHCSQVDKEKEITDNVQLGLKLREIWNIFLKFWPLFGSLIKLAMRNVRAIISNILFKTKIKKQVCHTTNILKISEVKIIKTQVKTFFKLIYYTWPLNGLKWLRLRGNTFTFFM